MKTVFLRVLDASDKATALLEAVVGPIQSPGTQRFELDPRRFARVPRSPFAYWVGEELFRVFGSTHSLGECGATVASTNQLSDDFRYVRSWWEVPSRDRHQSWIPWAKGGSFSPYYHDIDTVVLWNRERGTYKGFLGTQHRPLERPASVQHFFRPGVTWPRRTQGGLSLRVMPRDTIFANKGPSIFVEDDDCEELLALLAVTNSRPFKAMVDMQMAFGSYEVGVLQRTPVPDLDAAQRRTLADLARRAWSIKRLIDTATQTSHAFSLPALLQVQGVELTASAAAHAEQGRANAESLASIQTEIDQRCFALYGVGEDDRRSIADGSGSGDMVGRSADEPDDIEDEADEEPNEAVSLSATSLAAELVSWTVGVAFGRYDVRLATGARSVPGEPEPFDPLLASSPGMLTGDDGLPLASRPADYPLAFPEDGVLLDDPGQTRDLTSAVRAVFESVFGTAADRWWGEVSAALDPTSHDARAWLSRSLFEHHLKRHSKSRRRAPIFWQIGTLSGRFSVWLYAHRLTRDTFLLLQNDLVGPKLIHEERQLATLVRDAGPNPSARERKEIASQEAFVDELRAMLDEIRRVAPLWNPHLDDGVVLTMAPLYRLVPQHKPWQRELRSKWDDLVTGKYDWAHLAMHLWPERVVPKCAVDRSLAIAHGLEDVFWVEDTDGNWTARPTPTQDLDALVRGRVSPAVKAAREDLVAAPLAGLRNGRAHGRRAAPTSRSGS